MEGSSLGLSYVKSSELENEFWVTAGSTRASSPVLLDR